MRILRLAAAGAVVVLTAWAAPAVAAVTMPTHSVATASAQETVDSGQPHVQLAQYYYRHHHRYYRHRYYHRRHY